MATMTLELPESLIDTPVKKRLDFRRLHAIKTEDEYQAVVATIRVLFDKGKRRSATEADLLEFLSVLAEAYEEEHVAMPSDASPQEVVTFLLEQNGLSKVDLYKTLGGKGRVSEFFSKKRPLSRQQMIALRNRLNIPIDLLVEEPSP
jgi:HTH-type transcriptional regulator / antitoxin HigA